MTPVNPGDVLGGKFRVEEVLGQGGMGVVVTATHLQLGQKVALKFLLADALENPEAVERFAREARAAVRIKSDHVARVSDVGKLENGAPYMVMEHLDGHDLAEELRQRGPLPVEEAVDYLLQALEAIAEAHSYNIVHRDLKPANLFLTARPDGAAWVKVLDFGISKVKDPAANTALTQTTALFGSPLYMSPEQLKSTRDVDPRSDIWSLGIILHELLTGAPAFHAETMPQLCAIILAEPPPPLRQIRPDAPAELEAIIQRCLAKDPQERFQNVGELALALAPFAPGSSTVTIERVTKLMGTHVPHRPPQQSVAGMGAAAAPGAVTQDVFANTSPPKRSNTGVLVALAGLGGLGLLAIVGVVFALGRSSASSAAPAASETVAAASASTAEPAPVPTTLPEDPAAKEGLADAGAEQPSAETEQDKPDETTATEKKPVAVAKPVAPKPTPKPIPKPTAKPTATAKSTSGFGDRK